MAKLTSHEIRARFLRHFEKADHTVVPSGSLIPENDPTLFFTNAGMVQFKDTFTGKQSRPYSRATSVQKVLRVSGKHNDLENVGRTPRHHTFFEMLGNFSFGDYFKEEAIHYAWDLLLGDFDLDPKRIWISVFEEDDEALDLWSQIPGVDPDRIQRMDAKENFWSMGETGPCGPCSELHWDQGPEYGPEGGPATESDRYLEFWNLVFMQFDRAADGTMTPLPRPSIDTGMGLERIAAIQQGVFWNYDTDCFTPIMSKAASLAGVKYGEHEEVDVALRVISDHARATAFCIADGLMPRNEDREYVLRRIMRRAIRFGVKIGLTEPFFYKTTDAVVAHMGDAYPDLVQRRSFIEEVVRSEEERFAETRDRGLSRLEQEFEAMKSDGRTVVDGGVAFDLYDTHGFPVDLTELIADEQGFKVDHQTYQTHMKQQRERSREHWQGSGESATDEVFHQLHANGIHTAFSGYTHHQGTTTVRSLLRDGQPVKALGPGDKGIVLVEKTPFYAESGGQVGDTGFITNQGDLAATITDTKKALDDLWLHHVDVTKGSITVGDEVVLEVDDQRRNLTRMNHTATHLMHAALRNVLGDHVAQKGSLVGPHRLRFDFSHHKAMTQGQIEAVEDAVNEQVLQNIALQTELTSIDAAKQMGAMALFGEKYGNEVRVVQIPGFSIELCGGTHVARTGDIGIFRITSESGLAAGVRRIEALTGPDALGWGRTRDQLIRQMALETKKPVDELPSYVRGLEAEKKALQKQLQQLEGKLSRLEAGDLASQAREIDGFKMISAEFKGSQSALRDEADRLRDQLGSGVVVLGARDDSSVRLVITVSKDLAGSKVHAGNLMRSLTALVGGKGGGRPDMAQGGGKDPSQLPQALEQAYQLAQP